MPKDYGKDLWEVEAIIGMKYQKQNDQILYEVKWKGLDASQNTWEPKQNLRYVKAMIRQFHKKQRLFNGKVGKESKPYTKTKKVFKWNKQRSEARENSQRDLIKQEQIYSGEMLELDECSERIEKDGQRLIGKTTSKTGKCTDLPLSSPLHRLNTKQKYQRQREKTQSKSMQTKIQQINSMQIEEDCSIDEDEGIEQILLNCQKLQETTVLLDRNKLYFQIPFTKDGNEFKLEMTKEQILKINPKWLNAYYMSFLK